MKRKTQRKFVALAKKAGMGASVHRKHLEDALSGCHNLVTRAKLRSRILRAAVLLLVVGFSACKSSKTHVTTYTPEPPKPAEYVITDPQREELLRVTQDGLRWTWSAKPEKIILQLIADTQAGRAEAEKAKTEAKAEIENLKAALAEKQRAEIENLKREKK